ncbi:hypothetical protein IAD21_02661 [Abditibacteriota bacterium]|nr:hypothetical protein IAD21_02661 [Abditibacteriota bacterium]
MLKGDSSKKEWSLTEFIPHLCQRPKMYVFNGTFHEVYTFVEGINFGRSLDSPFAKEWSNFHLWLLKKRYIRGS